jgi:protein phosphatase methylesterase 1
MQRDLLKARLGKLPQLPAVDPNGNELTEEEAEEAKDDFLIKPAVLPKKSVTQPSPCAQHSVQCIETDLTRLARRRRLNGRPSRDYSPLSAADSFADALSVSVNLISDSTAPSSDTFRVYYTPPSPPTDDQDASGGGNGVVFVCVHGAGYSGLSWAAFAQELTKQSKGKVGVLAYDARAHGEYHRQLRTDLAGR